MKDDAKIECSRVPSEHCSGAVHSRFVVYRVKCKGRALLATFQPFQTNIAVQALRIDKFFVHGRMGKMMFNRFSCRVLGVGAILSLALLSGCGSNGMAASGLSADASKKIKTVVPTPPAPTPTPITTPTPTSGSLAGVLSEGDSISAFWGGNHTGIFAAANPTVTFHGNAVGGSTLNDPTGGNGLMQRQATDLNVHAKILTVLIGANDLNVVGLAWSQYPTPQAYLDALFAYVAPFRAAGTKVAVGTVLPQCTTGNPQLGADLRTNTNRVPVNDGIRAAVGTKIDAVIDFAADPVMGPDAAACDTTLYQPGGLHPTDGAAGGVGGQGKLELIYAPVVERLLAS